MNPVQVAAVLSIGLFVAMVGCLEAGYRVARHGSGARSESGSPGVGAVEAAVFALLGLLLGFSFSGATSRLDTRRQLIVEEANAIGTAYLRLDLLPAGDQPPMRELFREYLDARLRMQERLTDIEAADLQLAHAEQLQQAMWSRAVAASRADSTQNAARLLLPALNETIDITTTRTIAQRTHLPWLIFGLLVILALLSGLLAGYAMGTRERRSWLHVVLYSAVVAITIYVVIDLDHPRSGLIRLDAADHALVKLRNSIRSP